MVTVDINQLRAIPSPTMVVKFIFCSDYPGADKCVFCLEVLTDGPTQALRCGHVFHQVCITNYAEALHVPLHLLKCPACKQTNGDMALLEAQLRGLTGSSEVVTLSNPVFNSYA